MPAGGIASSDNWWVSKNPITGKPGPGKPGLRPGDQFIMNPPRFPSPGQKPSPSPRSDDIRIPTPRVPVQPPSNPSPPPRSGDIRIPTPRVPVQPPSNPAPYPKRDAGKY